MKEGFYTTINGSEYEIGIRESNRELSFDSPNANYPYSAMPKKEIILFTDEADAADSSFTYNDKCKRYEKAVEKSDIKEVHRYRTLYFYKGYRVAKMGGRDDTVTLSLDYGQRDLALELGFRELDCDIFIKDVNISEVELTQEGPFDVAFPYTV